MIKRIVVNIGTEDATKSQAFYGEILGLDLLMDHGWIQTYGNTTQMPVQLSIATEGGSGTPVPDLSIEVENLDFVLEKFRLAAIPIEYGPVEESWGVRRFYVRDPDGKLLNILQHC